MVRYAGISLTAADQELEQRVHSALVQFRLGQISARERQALTNEAFAQYRSAFAAGQR